MSEQKLRKLFSLPKNLYTSGSPIIIADGGLYRDESGERFFLGLSFKDIKAKQIDNFKVKIQGFDAVWKPVGDFMELVFAELKEENLMELDNPVKELYAVDAVISRVTFKDGSIWENTEVQWVPLEESDITEGSFFNPDVVEERRQQYKEKMNKI